MGAVSHRLRLGMVAWLALAAGCATSRPQLDELHPPELRRPGQPPVVFVPGLMGARLADATTGREAWPRSALNLLARGHRELAVAIAPSDPYARELRVTGIFDATGGRDFYGGILRTLERNGGYRRAAPGEPVRDATPRYYVFAYDWRRDNVATARALDAFLAQIRVDHGRPELRVDVIAHSQGGLVVRYYARYGAADALGDAPPAPTGAGEARLRRVVLLGTPNLGTVEGVRSLIEGFRIYATGHVAPETVLTMPAAYQLLPHPGTPWLVASDGRVLPADLYDPATWRRHRWAVYSPRVRRAIVARAASAPSGEAYLAALERYFVAQLERARRFAFALDVPHPEGRLRYATFGGDCTPTPAHVVVERRGDGWHPWFDARDVRRRVAGVDYRRLLHDPGDGIVTKASMLGHGAAGHAAPADARPGAFRAKVAFTIFLCEYHNQLAHNLTLHDNLLDYLLRPD